MFLVDTMCGRFAKWLRILSYDAEWLKDKERTVLIVRCLKESRILITRDHRFQNTRGIKKVILETNDIAGQIHQLAEELHLKINPDDFFKRCSFCNKMLQQIDKKEIMKKIPPYVYEVHQKFYQCSRCQRIYWNGTHLKLFQKQISEILRPPQ